MSKLVHYFTIYDRERDSSKNLDLLLSFSYAPDLFAVKWILSHSSFNSTLTKIFLNMAWLETFIVAIICQTILQKPKTYFCFFFQKHSKLCHLWKEWLILNRIRKSPQTVNIILFLSLYIFSTLQVNSCSKKKWLNLNKACKSFFWYLGIRTYPLMYKRRKPWIKL